VFVSVLCAFVCVLCVYCVRIVCCSGMRVYCVRIVRACVRACVCVCANVRVQICNLGIPLLLRKQSLNKHTHTQSLINCLSFSCSLSLRRLQRWFVKYGSASTG
jgi:hypothetical protein